MLIGELRVLPRTTDLAMPHLWDMMVRLAEPVTRADGALPLWAVVALAALTTLGIAAAGWAVGVIVGIAFALLMQRWRLAEFGLLPWIVISQTVPLIAFAPVVKSWGSRVEIGSFEWQDWMSVALIASYLAFFPITVGALKGLQSPDRIHVELFETYASGYWPTLQGGIGRLLIQFAGQASGDPSKAWGPIFGAIVLGLVAAGSVALLGVILKDYRRTEEAA